MFYTVIFIFLAFLPASIYSAEPVATQIIAKIGEQVTLKCQFPAGTNQCGWTKNFSSVLSDSESMINQDEAMGVCSLTIANIDEKDLQIPYKCSHTNGIVEKVFQIFVLKTPSKNYLSYKGTEYANPIAENRVTYSNSNSPNSPNSPNLECISEGGSPPPMIGWNIDPPPTSNKPINTDTVLTDDKITSTLQLDFLKEKIPDSYSSLINPAYESKITCTVTYKIEDGTKKSKEEIQIVIGKRYPTTQVKLTHVNNNITCEADGNPTPEIQLQRKANDNWEFVQAGTNFVVDQLGTYRCVAKYQNENENEIQVDSEEAKIDKKEDPKTEESKEKGGNGVGHSFEVSIRLLLIFAALGFLLR